MIKLSFSFFTSEDSIRSLFGCPRKENENEKINKKDIERKKKKKD